MSDDAGPDTGPAEGRPWSTLSHLECPRCGDHLDASVHQGLCPRDGSPLLARYDLSRVVVRREEVERRPPDLWRYHELLPVQGPEGVVTLGEGMTPLLDAPRLAADLGVGRLLVKDEGLLPTGSFKARGAAVGVSRARELGVRGLAMPTNGNAGAAWAAYAARAGLPLLVAMPVGAPAITRAECVAAGAQLHLVDGLISDAGKLVAAAVAEDPDRWTDVATLKEPYRIEGKKTMGFEIAEQLGWRMPDVVVYPTGGGVGLIGIWKALHELLELGWVSGRMPRLVAVQATGCAPIVRAFEAGAEVSEPWVDASTVAFGITVPKALGDFLVLRAVRETGGTALAVDDEELLAELQHVGSLEGLVLCPEGAAVVSAVRRLRGSGWIGADEEVVVLNTGAGIIYPEALPVRVGDGPGDVPVVAKDGRLEVRRG
ncbi:threonine synthase [Pseudokineococcus marinus]|uniref:threonine synthase n=1 Tax=Pseudokineococcus marinus TaxID=351215 RepID=UPI001BB2DAF9|nr:threonine synthase [Pseudokineococcus marinus]